MSETDCITRLTESFHSSLTSDATSTWSKIVAALAKTAAETTDAELISVALIDHRQAAAHICVTGSTLEKHRSECLNAAVRAWTPEQHAKWLSKLGSAPISEFESLVIANTVRYSAGLLYLLNDDHQTSMQKSIPSLCGLAASIFEQTDQLISLRTQFEQAKLESLAEFAAGAGHEINNPIATISGRVQLLLQQEPDPARKQALTTIGGQALRIRDMIGDLMLYGRPPAGDPERIGLRSVLENVVEQLNLHQLCRLHASLDETVHLWADRGQLTIVVSEILRNSLNAADGDLTINISVEQRKLSQTNGLQIRIQDDGKGLTAMEREHLFDPFYSGRQAGRGLGFGLSKCWRIVKNHRGTIQALPNEGKGLTLEIWWPTEPVSDSASAPPSESDS